MSDLIIRPLRDTAEARLCAASMAASDPWLTLGFSEETIFRGMTNPAREAHIGEIENKVAGSLVLHLDGLLNGYIQTIAVHSEFQNRGLGKQLVRFAEERIFRQRPNVFLCVSSFNHRARKFYESLGYCRVGDLPDYVVRGHSEILMRKTKGPLSGFAPQK